MFEGFLEFGAFGVFEGFLEFRESLGVLGVFGFRIWGVSGFKVLGVGFRVE